MVLANVEFGDKNHKVTERDLYDNMISTKGKLKKGYVSDFDVPGAGFSYRLDLPRRTAAALYGR